MEDKYYYTLYNNIYLTYYYMEDKYYYTLYNNIYLTY